MDNLNKQVIDYYQNLESRLGYTFLTWDAKHFGYYPEGQNNINEKKAQELMQDLLVKKLSLKRNATVLDVGCGRGVVASYITQKYGFQITGIDIVPFELELAKKRIDKLGLKNNISLHRMDYSKTTFPDNYFDAIYTMEALVHSPDLKRTLKEFIRILKPGGKLVSFEYSRSYPKYYSFEEEKTLAIINQGSAMLSLGKLFHDKWVRLLKETGYKKTTQEDITKNMLPSAFRFYRYAYYPYQVIKLLHLQRIFINTTAGVEFYRFLKKRLIRYNILTSYKAGSDFFQSPQPRI